MDLKFIDLETFFSDGYTLNTITPVEYVLDPRFEAIGCAVQEGLDGKPYWVDGPSLPKFFSESANDVCMVSHNMLFDGCVTAWRYNYRPKMYSDTMALARATLSSTLDRFRLSSVAVHLKVGGKLEGVLATAKGRNYSDIKADAQFYPKFVEYGLTDVALCAGIFKQLMHLIPVEELAVLDMVIRMALMPRFDLDQEILLRHLSETIAEKQRLLSCAGITDRSVLMSNPQFADILRHYGVEPPTKISPTTKQVTYAFAKTDEAFRALLEHDDSVIQALVAARLGVKSTIEETRTERFLAISRLTWPPPLSGTLRWMPIPLRYGAAHTHRFGGEWNLNAQNLGRRGNLRKSLRAPPGHKVVKVDAEQIEARLTAWLAGEVILLGEFERGEDPYCNFGTVLFQKPVSQDTPVERSLAKAGVLGCGFGMGWKKFLRTTNTARLPDGNGGVISIDTPKAMQIVNGYRSRYWRVPKLWQHLQANAIPCLAGYGVERMMVGPILLVKNKAILPSLDGQLGQGLSLSYRDLRFDQDPGEWSFAWGPTRRKKLYSAKLLENFVQALDRVLVIGAALRLQKLLSPYGLAHQAHDENVYVVPVAYAQSIGELVREEMARRPPWGPDLPLSAKLTIGDSYG